MFVFYTNLTNIDLRWSAGELWQIFNVERIGLRWYTSRILTRYEDMPQSPRTPMLCDGWLIDWVRGYASQSAHFKNRWLSRNKPTTLGHLQPASAHSNQPFIQHKKRQNLRQSSRKRGKKVQATFIKSTKSTNQPSNNMDSSAQTFKQKWGAQALRHSLALTWM